MNNRAKRQQIRALMKDENITDVGKINLLKGFLNLAENDDKTIELINKMLQKLQRGGTER